MKFFRKKEKTDEDILQENTLSDANQQLKIFQHDSGSFRILFIFIALLFFSFFILVVFDKFEISLLFQLFKNPNVDNVLGGLLANAGGEIILGLLGIVMMVVAIVVQLAATRYTARVSDLFIRDKVNMLYLILLTFTGLNLIIILYFSRSYKIPSFLINITVISMLTCIITLVPYFIHVFKFLEPMNIISRIERDILQNAKRAKRIKNINPAVIEKKINLFQAHVVQDIDQLTDIILNSINKNDKILATNCIKSLRNFSIDYIELKSSSEFVNCWFQPSDFVRYNNADFVTLRNDSFEYIVNEKTWVEHKLFRQLNNVFQESLNKARDICNFTAQCFYIIGKKAIEKNDLNVCLLVIKFFNTMIRATINAGDVRTCFNLFNQYRLFGESLVEAGKEKFLIDMATYFKYYGLLAKEVKKMTFIIEIVAHDLCDLNKKVYLKGLDKKGEILDIILTVDQPLEGEKETSPLRGIRKAQITLVTFYMSQEDDDGTKIARKILYDVLDEVDSSAEGYERIFLITKELKYVKPEFWEIIDRGLNIDYIPDNQKKYLVKFMDWIITRQLLLYSRYTLKEEAKAHNILNEFFSTLINLPEETPMELKEFEEIYGQEGMDNRPAVYKHILKIVQQLNDPQQLKIEIQNLKDFKLEKVSDELLNDFINGIKKFENEFKSEYKKRFEVEAVMYKGNSLNS